MVSSKLVLTGDFVVKRQKRGCRNRLCAKFLMQLRLFLFLLLLLGDDLRRLIGLDWQDRYYDDAPAGAQAQLQ